MCRTGHVLEGQDDGLTSAGIPGRTAGTCPGTRSITFKPSLRELHRPLSFVTCLLEIVMESLYHVQLRCNTELMSEA